MECPAGVLVDATSAPSLLTIRNADQNDKTASV